MQNLNNPHSTATALPPALLLMGPTASGKTAVAIAIAKQLPCEIISVDSAQIYLDMNVGTAKPELEILAHTPHHLINIISPEHSYSAARFCDDALDLMHKITARGRIPLLVGGTMLYFKALLEGLNSLPQADPEIRQAIEDQAASAGWSAVYNELQTVDPVTANRLQPGDTQRVQRALEIYRITGQAMSALLDAPRLQNFPYRAITIALTPSVRAELHQRIAVRFNHMLAQGLVDELTALKKTYDLHAQLPAMRCVGYRQAWDFLNNQINQTQLREQGIAATRQLAKRQLTWLRAMPELTTFDCLDNDLETQVLQYIQHQLKSFNS